MRFVFCDDHPVIRDQLQEYVADYFRERKLPMPEFAAYESAEAMLAAERRVDMAFLDVEMGGISGIQAGVALRKFSPYAIVFIVTAYPDYLDEAMQTKVFRYLSKPVDKERLHSNLQEALRQYNQSSREYAIVTADGVVMRRAEEIICVEAMERRVLVHTPNGIFVSTDTMEHWKSTLTLPCFYSPHRSFIINMRYVSIIGKDKILLKYGDREKEAYLTRRKYKEFKEAFLLYLERGK